MYIRKLNNAPRALRLIHLRMKYVDIARLFFFLLSARAAWLDYMYITMLL